MKLTIYFDGQFWVGVVEEVYGDHLTAAHHVFGAEPQDADVLAFVNHAIPAMLAAPAVADTTPATAPAKISPKRRRRLAAAATRATGIGTKAQQAIKEEYAARQQAAQTLSREQKDAALAYKRARQRERAKGRHRGH